MTTRNKSMLNTVQASHADYAYSSPYVYLTNLLPFNKKNCTGCNLQLASSYYGASVLATQQKFYTLDTACPITTVSTASDTLTWSSGTPDTFTGEILTVTSNSTGLVYYAVIAAGGTGATGTAAAWVGVNGVPPVTSGGTPTYTVVRQGYSFTKVDFADISSQLVQVQTNFSNAYSLESNLVNFGYNTATSITAANQALEYYNTIHTPLTNSGFFNTYVSDVVYIMNPPNQSLKVAASTQNGYTAPTITSYNPVNRVGYGADLIAKLGLPAASSSTANDGIVATEFYDTLTIKVQNDGFGGSPVPTYTLQMYVNVSTESTDGPALTAYVITQLP